MQADRLPWQDARLPGVSLDLAGGAEMPDSPVPVSGQRIFPDNAPAPRRARVTTRLGGGPVTARLSGGG